MSCSISRLIDSNSCKIRSSPCHCPPTASCICQSYLRRNLCSWLHSPPVRTFHGVSKKHKTCGCLWIIPASKTQLFDTDPTHTLPCPSICIFHTNPGKVSLLRTWGYVAVLICKPKRSSSKKINSNPKWHFSFIKSALSGLHYLIGCIYCDLWRVKSHERRGRMLSIIISTLMIGNTGFIILL